MPRRIFLTSALLLCAGCAALGPSPPPGDPAWYAPPMASGVLPNPLPVTVADPHVVWEAVVDVVDDYFRIMEEQPVRVVGTTATEGRLATFPEPAATILEPWRRDSVGCYDRLKSTVQSIRRYAQVRVAPGQGGYWIDVAVFNELEDARPFRSTAGAATFNYDAGLVRVVEPIAEQEVNRGWIPYGRDDLLEQRILGHLQDRFAGCGEPVWVSQQPQTPTATR